MVVHKALRWLVIPLSYLALAGSGTASEVDGLWRVRDLVLIIYDCQAAVCGKIVWIDDPVRRRSQCGRVIVWGLAHEGPSKWGGGYILDPDDEKTYRLAALYELGNTLRARIYKGIPLLGKTEVLQRVDPNGMTGRC